MAAEDEKLKRISEKVQRLVKTLHLLQQENQKLRLSLETLQAKQITNTEQLNELTLRNEVLKATKSKLSEEEKKSLNRKINDYIKEIDRCIALINT